MKLPALSLFFVLHHCYSFGFPRYMLVDEARHPLLLSVVCKVYLHSLGFTCGTKKKKEYPVLSFFSRIEVELLSQQKLF